MKVIKLTDVGGGKIHVNVDGIRTFQLAGNFTQLRFDGSFISIKETPDQICTLLDQLAPEVPPVVPTKKPWYKK